MNINQLNKLFSEADIPKAVKEQGNLGEEAPYHINVLWDFYTM